MPITPPLLRPRPPARSFFFFVSAATFPSSRRVNFMQKSETFHSRDLSYIVVGAGGESRDRVTAKSQTEEINSDK